MNHVVIFAGGTGSRMGSEVPKQFLKVDEKPIIIHTVEVFERSADIDDIVIVCIEDYIGYSRELINKFDLKKVIDVIPGGSTGQMSIFNGLSYVYKNISRDVVNDIVLIHDGVRPLVGEELIRKNVECAMEYGNSISVAKAIETIITVDDKGEMKSAIDRSRCRYAKAPQCFRLSDIYEAHLRAQRDGHRDLIDSATLMSMYGHKLYTVECKNENIKITTPIDYYMFKAIYEARKDQDDKV